MKKVNKTTAFIIRLGHLGDVALTTGVLKYWHEKRNMQFVFLTRAAYVPILQGHPAILKVIPLEDPTLSNTTSWLRECSRLAKEFGSLPLIDLHGNLRSHILAMRWPGPVRRYSKFSIYRRLFNKTRSSRIQAKLEETNVPQRYTLALEQQPPPAEAVIPHINIAPEEIAQAQTLLATQNPAMPLVALHPYATHPAKQWPAHHWHELIRLLQAKKINWIIVGRSSKPLLQNPQDLTNKTDLRSTCALLAKASVMVTNDSGPMHLAAGVGTPVIGLFGPTVRAWGFYPAGEKDIALEPKNPNRPCSLHGAKACPNKDTSLESITPEQVLSAIDSILGS